MLTRTASFALLVAAIGLAGPAAAQEDTGADATAPAENTTTAEGDATTSDIELGTPVDPDTGRPNGELYLATTQGDWEVRCVTLVEDEDPCVMYQLLRDEAGAEVAEIALRPLPDGGQAVAAGNIVAPLETFLPAQLTLSIDGGAAVRYPYTFCTERPFSPFMSTGCVSQVGMTDQLVGAMKAGNAAIVTVRAAANREEDVRLTLSLSGFTAAFNTLTGG